MLEDQLAILTGMWATPAGERFDYTGRQHQIVDSPALPKPVQRPRPPIIIGGYGAKRTPRLAAQYADEFNLPFPPLDYYRPACDVVRAACETAGRDPAIDALHRRGRPVCRPRRERSTSDARRRSAARPTTCARTQRAGSSTRSSNACAPSVTRAPRPSTCKCSTSTISTTCDSSRPRSRPTSRRNFRGRPLRSARRSPEHEHRRAARTVAPDRGARFRLDLDLGPLLRRRQHRQPALPRGDHDARRARGDDRASAVRFARVLRGLPAPRGARQRDRDPRPDRGGSGRARPRRRLAAAGVRRLRDALRHARRTSAHAERVHPVRARTAHAGRAPTSTASSSRCATRSANRSRCRNGCRSGSAAAARR